MSTSDDDLAPGWAPGLYWHLGCRKCGNSFTASKRSWLCRPCCVHLTERGGPVNTAPVDPIRAAVLAERERCAMVAEDSVKTGAFTAKAIARLIRKEPTT
jgi:hypothetical protein